MNWNLPKVTIGMRIIKLVTPTTNLPKRRAKRLVVDATTTVATAWISDPTNTALARPTLEGNMALSLSNVSTLHI